MKEEKKNTPKKIDVQITTEIVGEDSPRDKRLKKCAEVGRGCMGCSFVLSFIFAIAALYFNIAFSFSIYSMLVFLALTFVFSIFAFICECCYEGWSGRVPWWY